MPRQAIPKPPQIIGYRVYVAHGGSMGYNDMLRYDHAYTCPTFPGYVVFVTYSIKGRGVFQGAPNFDRWYSFGVLLNEPDYDSDTVSSLVATIRAHVQRYPDQWATQIHPRVGMTTDYGQLVPQTLAEFLSPSVTQ